MYVDYMSTDYKYHSAHNKQVNKDTVYSAWLVNGCAILSQAMRSRLCLLPKALPALEHLDDS